MAFWDKLSGRGVDKNEAYAWHQALADSSSDLVVTRSSASVYDRIYTSRERYDGRRSSNPYYRETLPVGDKEIIKACNDIYATVGVVRNGIDLMQEFASEGLNFRTENDKLRKFFVGWAEAVKLREVLEWIFLEFYKSGNVVIHKSTRVLTPSEISDITKYITHADRPVKEFKNRELPVAYTVLNPLNIDKVGSLVFGDFVLQFTLPAEVTQIVSNPKSEAEKKIRDMINQMSKNSCTAGGGIGRNFITLDPKYTSIIHRKKQPYEKWAKPFLYAILDDIYYKNKLRMMDRAAADSIISSIVLLKVGSDEFPAQPETIRKVAEMLTSEAKSMYFVWNHAISMESDYAPIGEILGEEKYLPVNRDILMGMGISEVILGGQGTNNYATSYLSVKTLLERLEDGRNKVIDWLKGEMKQVAEAMGFDNIPEVEFAHMSLKDEASENEIIIRCYERNLISPRTAIDALRGNQYPSFEEEISRMKELNDLQDDGLFMKPQQIQAGGGIPLSLMGLPEDGSEPIVQKMNKKNQQTKKVGEDRGRPSNQPNTKKIPERKVKPKGASIIDFADSLGDNNTFADKTLEIVKSNVKEGLRDEDVFYIFSQMTDTDTEEAIAKKAKWFSSENNEAGIFAEKNILKAFTKLLKRWKENNAGHSPDENTIEKLWKNSWVIVRTYEKFIKDVKKDMVEIE